MEDFAWFAATKTAAVELTTIGLVQLEHGAGKSAAKLLALNRASAAQPTRNNSLFIEEFLILRLKGHASRSRVHVIDDREARREVAWENLVRIHAVLVAPRAPGPLNLIVVLPNLRFEDVPNPREFIRAPIGPKEDRPRRHIGVKFDVERVAEELIDIAGDLVTSDELPLLVVLEEQPEDIRRPALRHNRAEGVQHVDRRDQDSVEADLVLIVGGAKDRVELIDIDAGDRQAGVSRWASIEK